MKYVKSFLPIESDPDILTTLMHSLGVSEEFLFEDVLDYNEEAHLPALALIVIFSESPEDEIRKAIIEADRDPVRAERVQFLRQTIDNSCGLIAIIHSVLNTAAADILRVNSVLYNAIRSPKGMTTFLEESEELETQYQAVANLGETAIPHEVKYHYVALVPCKSGHMWELDGERSSPLLRGSAKIGYVLDDPNQIAEIVRDLSRGSHDCSLYKLTQRLE